MEKAVMEKEAEIAELESHLSDSGLYQNTEKALAIQLHYQKAQKELEELYQEWENAESALNSDN